MTQSGSKLARGYTRIMFKAFQIDAKADVPIVRQIQDHLRNEINSGEAVPGEKLPSMREIASHLGVSLGIVKQALNTLVAEGYLSAAPRRGVFIAKPRGLVREIALVLPLIEHEQMIQVIHGVRKALRGSGYHLVIHSADADYTDEINVLGQLDLTTVAGVLVYPPRLLEHAKALTQLGQRGVPCVQVVMALDPEGTNAVVVDGVEMGRMGFDHLLSRGHRHIGFVDATADAPTNTEIRDGAAMALTRAGLSFSQLATTSVAGGVLDSEAPWAMGEEAANRLMKEHPELTAIIGVDPHVTLGIYRAVKASGKQIGQDMSILGLGGDLPAFAMLEPSLTVVDGGIEDISSRAVRRLQRIIKGQDTRVYSIFIPPSLVIRNSVGDRATESRRG